MGKHSSSSSSKSSSSSGGKQASSSGTSSKTYKKIWYCCNCNYGPNNYRIDDSCPNCTYRRCDDCDVRTIPIDPRR